MSQPNVVDESNVWYEKDRHVVRTYRLDVSHLLARGTSVTGVTWAQSGAAGSTPLEVLSQAYAPDALMIQLGGGTPKKWYAATATFTTSDGDTQTFTVRLFIPEDVEMGLVMGSALFPNRFVAIKRLMNDRLLGVAKGALPNVKISGDYLWEKILAAEAEISRQLRIELQPTRFFPLKPTDAQIAALGEMPWKVDPGYDYEPGMLIGNQWGFTQLRNRPLIRIESISVNYPAQDQSILDIPPEWIRFDPRSAQVNLVPTGMAPTTSLATSILGGLVGTTRLPFAMHIHYVAGVEDAARTHPDLVDVVLKTATLKVMEDAFLPQSGSISADGLSRSVSRDTEKYQEALDAKLFGAKGSNGGLWTAFHGVTLGVF